MTAFPRQVRRAGAPPRMAGICRDYHGVPGCKGTATGSIGRCGGAHGKAGKA